MSIIKVENGTVKEVLYDGVTKEQTKQFLCEKELCDVCGENLWQADFIIWRGTNLIAICKNCAEHTINGLSRDVYEIKGHEEAHRCSGELFGVVFLRTEIERLQTQVTKYSARIVDLQNLLARRV